jgi:hypothetical protein
MHLAEFFKWLQETRVASGISDSLWLFPFVETIHVLVIVILVGATGILDLRLMGLALKREPVSQLSKQLMPWAWSGFALMLITGSLLFSSESTKLYNNGAFLFKMGLIVLAGVNAVVFQTTVYRTVGTWDEAPVAPMGARLAGCCSLLLWIGVVAAGRWIAYW